LAWAVLILAGLLEVVWAFAMKQSAGFTRAGWTALTGVALVGSMALLSVAMRSLPLGTAYTIWTGIGAIGAFVLGIIVLGEAATPLRIVAAVMIVGGLALMKLASP
jgi:quaternary ammonium compound-resistance protein SugE